MGNKIFVVNSGSSSVKCALFCGEEQLFSAEASPIGKNAQLTIKNAECDVIRKERLPLNDQRDALEHIAQALPVESTTAVAHRLVHGGNLYSKPLFVDEEVLEKLSEITSYDPLHLPVEIMAIHQMKELLPDAKEIACFDTSFHAAMPEAAKTFALPASLVGSAIHRYGFHGLSYEYVVGTLQPKGKSIIAHLGSGASMVALEDGKPIDTSMGFTSTGGLVMATRSGDLDPGVVVYLMEAKKITPAKMREILNNESGLQAISGITGDMQELLKLETSHEKARLAIEIFCRESAKQIGAYCCLLGGVDNLIFTGGIGENSPLIRARICHFLHFLGVDLDHEKNLGNKPEIQSSNSCPKVHVIKTNEELMIAKHAYALIEKSCFAGKK